MTTERNILFEQLCGQRVNFPTLIPDIHAWLMGNLEVREMLEGTFAPDHPRAYRSHDHRYFNRQARYTLRRYKNYIVGFVEDWDALYEFLPDRVYRHPPAPHHLYPTPPSYDFQSRIGLSTSYAFYQPKGVRSVIHRRLRLTSTADLTGPFEFAWVHRSVDEDRKFPHLAPSKLYQDGTFGASNGQLIRDIEDVLRSTTRRLFPNQEKLVGNPYVIPKGGYWWKRVFQEISITTTAQRLVKLRNDFEAFDPPHPNLVEVYMKAKDMTLGGNASEWVFDEFLVDCVKLLTAVVTGNETA